MRSVRVILVLALLLGIVVGQLWVFSLPERSTRSAERGASAPAIPVLPESSASIDGSDESSKRMPGIAAAPLSVPGIHVSGQVVAEITKHPIPGALVIQDDSRRVLTDDQGRFSLEGLPEGRLELQAVARGFAVRKVGLETEAGPEIEVRIALFPGGAVEGVVVHPDGRPAAGATVWTYLESAVVREKTDAAGQFRLDGLSLTERNFGVTAWSGSMLEGKAEVIGFPEGEIHSVSGLKIELREKETCSILGRTLDSDGSPVAGTSIYTDESEDEALATSDDQGRFRIEKAPKDAWWLMARKKGFAPASIELYGVPCEDWNDIELVLEPGHFLGGKVLGNGEMPAAEAKVVIVLGSDHQGPDPSVETDPEGRFLFQDLPRKPASIRVEKGGYCALSVEFDEESPGEFPGVDRKDLKLMLEEARQIRGVVVDKESGEPIQQFKLTLAISITSHPPRPMFQFSSPGGEFSVRELRYPEYPQELLVIADEYQELMLEHVSPWPLSENREPLRLELERGETLSGIVVSERTEEPLIGVQVVYLFDSRLIHSQVNFASPQIEYEWAGKVVFTDQEGKFSIHGASAAPRKLLLDKPGFARMEIPEARPGPDLQVFKLPMEAVVAGTVKHLKSVSAVHVKMLDRRYFPESTVDSGGHYRIEGLPPGEAVISLTGPGKMTQKRRILLAAGEEETVEDFEEWAGAISGVVTLRGEPVVGAAVYINADPEGNAGDHGPVETVAHGRFEFGSLRPGSYQVVAGTRGNVSLYSAQKMIVKIGEDEARCDIVLPTSRISVRVMNLGSVDPDEVENMHIKLYRSDSEAPPEERLLFEEKDWWFYDAVQESPFEFDAVDPGRYYVVASTYVDNSARGPIGWLGPLLIDGKSSLEDVVLKLGARGNLALRVLAAADGAPIQGAWIKLEPVEGLEIDIIAFAGSGGEATIEGIPLGKYLLKITAHGHLKSTEPIEISGGQIGRCIYLLPTSRIALELQGPRDPETEYRVFATVLSGDDPGWRHRWENGRPAGGQEFETGDDQKARANFETRPGRYRIRLDLKTAGALPGAPPLLSQETDLIVPEGGEAQVTLEVPAG